MSKDGNMHDLNHKIPDELRELEAGLDRLGEAERGVAADGFESRLLDAVGAAMVPDPIEMPSSRAPHFSHRMLGIAAGVLLVGSVGLLTWVSAGLLSTPTALDSADQFAFSEVALEDDVSLLLELVETDYGVLDSESVWSFGAEVDDLEFEVLQMDSELGPEWDSLSSLMDPFIEGSL